MTCLTRCSPDEGLHLGDLMLNSVEHFAYWSTNSSSDVRDANSNTAFDCDGHLEPRTVSWEFCTLSNNVVTNLEFHKCPSISTVHCEEINSQ